MTPLGSPCFGDLQRGMTVGLLCSVVVVKGALFVADPDCTDGKRFVVGLEECDLTALG